MHRGERSMRDLLEDMIVVVVMLIIAGLVLFITGVI